MDFTPEQEQELIEQNMHKIYRAVDNYSARHTSSVATVPYDDFVQEVSIAYLMYIRHCKTMEEVNRFPWFSAMGAMRNLVLQYQPMKCSSDRSAGSFSKIIHNMPSTMSLEDLRAKTGFEIDGMSKHWVEDKETQIDFDSFMSDQPESVQRIVSMRMYGMTMPEIGNQFGVSKHGIDKRLKRLYDPYKIFMEGAENE